MPREGSKGVGLETDHKQADFSRIVEAHVRIVGNILARQWQSVLPYYSYFDLTAGDGYSLGKPGSALIVPRTAARHGVPFRGWFFERSESEANALRANLRGEHGQSTVLFGDHRETCGPLAVSIAAPSRRRYGLIYWDGNADAVIPSGTIGELLADRSFACTDVLLYVSATSIKRVRGLSEVRNVQQMPERLDIQLQQVGKQYGLIRQPAGPWQWTFALLTNWDAFPNFRRQGFVPLVSKEGLECLRRLSLTSEEWKEYQQPTLPYFQLPGISATPVLFGDPPGGHEAREGNL